MCACKQKRKSFFIADILRDQSKANYQTLSHEPTQPLRCTGEERAENPEESQPNDYEEKLVQFEVMSEVSRELEMSKIQHNLEQRRNTFPLYSPLYKSHVPAMPWMPYKFKEFDRSVDPGMLYDCFGKSQLASALLRNRLAGRLVYQQADSSSYQTHNTGPIASGWGMGWWPGSRRKGGQVRFSAAQTTALERRFNANKYLSPEERRAFASGLRLSDRQVKTWFQNRRAKWRRLTPDSTEGGGVTSDIETASDEDSLATN